MATGESIISKGPIPPDLSSMPLSFVVPTFPHQPSPGIKHGDMKEDVNLPVGKSFNKGDGANTTFWSANPRFDLFTGGAFTVIETLKGERLVLAYDDNFCLYFKWNVRPGGSRPEDVGPGIYWLRLRHFGSSKVTEDSPTEYFTVAPSALTIS